MKQIPITLLLLCLTFSAMAEAPAEKRSTILDVLKVDQQVSLKEDSGRYEIRFFDGLQNAQAYTIKAIVADHLIVADIVGVNEIRIPVYSIKAIVRVKLAGK